LLISGDRLIRIFVFLDIDQAGHPVLLRELAMPLRCSSTRRPTSFVTPMYIVLSELLVMM